METIQIVLDKRLLHATDQAARRTKRNRSALVRYASGNISGDWRSEIKKNATARAIRSSRTRPISRSFEKRRRRGQQNRQGDVQLYQFAPPDKKRPVAVLTRDSAIPYVERHCRTYHICPLAPKKSNAKATLAFELRLTIDDIYFL